MDSQLRWTCPWAGSYQFIATLRMVQIPTCGDGIVFNLTATSAKNVLAQGTINPGSSYSFSSQVVTLAAGEPIVLAILRNANFVCDTTALDIVVNQVVPTVTTSSASVTSTTVQPIASTTLSSTSTTSSTQTTTSTTFTTSTTSSTTTSATTDTSVTSAVTSADSTLTSESTSTTSLLSGSLNIAISTSVTSASITATTGTPSVPEQQVLVVEQDIYVANSWSAPPIIVFNGGSIEVPIPSPFSLAFRCCLHLCGCICIAITFCRIRASLTCFR